MTECLLGFGVNHGSGDMSVFLRAIRTFEKICSPKVVIILSLLCNTYFILTWSSPIKSEKFLILQLSFMLIAEKQIGLKAFKVKNKKGFVLDNRFDMLFMLLTVGYFLVAVVALTYQGLIALVMWELWLSMIYPIYLAWADFDISSQGGAGKLDERTVVR